MPLSAIGSSRLSWIEAWALVERLALDTSSHLCAAIKGWDYPLSREALILADLFDLTALAHIEKKHRRSFKPYRRPWKQEKGRRSKSPTVNQATVRALLDARKPRASDDPADEAVPDPMPDEEVTADGR